MFDCRPPPLLATAHDDPRVHVDGPRITIPSLLARSDDPELDFRVGYARFVLATGGIVACALAPPDELNAEYSEWVRSSVARLALAGVPSVGADDREIASRAAAHYGPGLDAAWRCGVGSPRPKVILVVERRPGVPEFPLARPGAGGLVLGALARLGHDGLTAHLAYVDAPTAGASDANEALRVMARASPPKIVVALGVVASSHLMALRVRHKVVPSPTWWRRYRSGDVAGYARALRRHGVLAIESTGYWVGWNQEIPEPHAAIVRLALREKVRV